MAKNIKADGASGIKVMSNPGSTLQVVGKDGVHKDNPEIGKAGPAPITFSQHPGHGSAKRTMAGQ